jgi:hypothetical protein
MATTLAREQEIWERERLERPEIGMEKEAGVL